MVKALSFHQCGPGSLPGLGVICGLSLLSVLAICSERFFSGFSGFLLSSKTNISKFQFDLDYCQVFYHEPLAREIVQTLPVLLTLNKLLYFTTTYLFPVSWNPSIVHAVKGVSECLKRKGEQSTNIIKDVEAD